MSVEEINKHIEDLRNGFHESFTKAKIDEAFTKAKIVGHSHSPLIYDDELSELGKPKGMSSRKIAEKMDLRKWFSVGDTLWRVSPEIDRTSFDEEEPHQARYQAFKVSRMGRYALMRDRECLDSSPDSPQTIRATQILEQKRGNVANPWRLNKEEAYQAFINNRGYWEDQRELFQWMLTEISGKLALNSPNFPPEDEVDEPEFMRDLQQTDG